MFDKIAALAHDADEMFQQVARQLVETGQLDRMLVKAADIRMHEFLSKGRAVLFNAIHTLHRRGTQPPMVEESE